MEQNEPSILEMREIALTAAVNICLENPPVKSLFAQMAHHASMSTLRLPLEDVIPNMNVNTVVINTQ
jgi:hypothetical protein